MWVTRDTVETSVEAVLTWFYTGRKDCREVELLIMGVFVEHTGPFPGFSLAMTRV